VRGFRPDLFRAPQVARPGNLSEILCKETCLLRAELATVMSSFIHAVLDISETFHIRAIMLPRTYLILKGRMDCNMINGEGKRGAVFCQFETPALSEEPEVDVTRHPIEVMHKLNYPGITYLLCYRECMYFYISNKYTVTWRLFPSQLRYIRVSCKKKKILLIFRSQSG
jgi:hypothetical protein